MPNLSLKVETYQPEHKAIWDRFVGDAKNATFLFYRDYMDYHADRFHDCSLLIYDEQELVALFPAILRDGVVTSHGGLTYGGVISSPRMTAKRMLAVFDGLRRHYANLPATRIVYKTLPYIYASLPADEDLYALFVNDARLIRRDISSTIFLPQRLPFAKGKKYNLSKARKAGIEVRKTDDYPRFWQIETEVLKVHNAKPVHSLDEITRLASAFPSNITLYGAFLNGVMLAGVVTYASGKTVHAQYMGATPEGQEHGALDAIIAFLLDNASPNAMHFDFGISTEQQGRYLNEGLIAQKEMFGGRAVMYDHYEIDL